jgi:hypothetical protein
MASSNSMGAASAVPMQIYIDLEGLITKADGEAIHARWVFGRQLLEERVGALLPKGRLAEVANAIGCSLTEIGIRMRVAERFPTEEELRDAVTKYGSWRKITRQGFADTSSRPKIQKPKPKRRKPSESGRRLRELHAERRNGRHADSLWHLQKAVALAVSELEFFDLPALGWDEETETLVLEIFDDLGRHARWNDEALSIVVAHMNDLGRQRKIQVLRARADDPSSTQAERETAARLADRLTRTRNAKQVSGALND